MSMDEELMMFSDADDVVIEEPVSDFAEEISFDDLPDAPKAEPINTGIDLSSLMSIPGVVIGDTGTTVSRFPVERMRFSEDKKQLISILSDQVIIAKTHYDEVIGGNFLCFGGDCCEKEIPRIRYVYPVLVYNTDNNGSPISKNYKFQALCLGQDSYEALQGVQFAKGSLTGHDFLITCSDAKYQRISVTEAGAARWTNIQGCQEAMTKFWAENMQYILKSIARSITPDEYAKLRQASEVPEMADLDFSAVFGA